MQGFTLVPRGRVRHAPETFLRATIIRSGGYADSRQVAPLIVSIAFAPAVRGAGGIGGSRFGREDAIQVVVSEALAPRCVYVIRDARHVAVVGRAQAEIVGVVQNVADICAVGAGSRGASRAFDFSDAFIFSQLELRCDGRSRPAIVLEQQNGHQ